MRSARRVALTLGLVASAPAGAGGQPVRVPALLAEAGPQVSTDGLAGRLGLRGGLGWGEGVGASPLVGWAIWRAAAEAGLSFGDGWGAWAGATLGRSWMLGGLVLEVDGGALARLDELGVGPQAAAAARLGAVGLRLGLFTLVGPEAEVGGHLGVDVDLLTLFARQ